MNDSTVGDSLLTRSVVDQSIIVVAHSNHPPPLSTINPKHTPKRLLCKTRYGASTKPSVFLLATRQGNLGQGRGACRLVPPYITSLDGRTRPCMEMVRSYQSVPRAAEPTQLPELSDDVWRNFSPVVQLNNCRRLGGFEASQDIVTCTFEAEPTISSPAS